MTRGKNKNLREARQVKQPFWNKCSLKCIETISDEQRQQIFDSYWALEIIEKQRKFISSSTKAVEPKYRLIKIGSLRRPCINNNDFYLKIREKNHSPFENTLNINERNTKTFIEKKIKTSTSILEDDQRGKDKNYPTVI